MQTIFNEVLTMSDKNHTNESKLTFWIDNSLLARFDEALKKMGYKNRAEWFRENVRDIIETVETKK